MKMIIFKKARSMLESQQQDNYQKSIILFFGKAILRKKLVKNLHQQSNIFEN